MYEYTCPACGKVHTVEHRSEVKVYCGKSCAVKHRYMMRRAEKEQQEKQWEEQREPQEGECIFCPKGVICYNRDCTNCGWNPVVAKARLEKWVEKNGNALG